MALRVAVVEHPFLAEQIARCFESMGAEVYRVPAGFQEPMRLVDEFQADCIIALNLINWGGSKEQKHRLFEKLPHICWILDPLVNHTTTVFNPDLIHPNYHIYSYDPNLVPVFKSKGFNNVAYHPLAPDMEPIPFPELPESKHDISYVGRSMMSVGNEYLTKFQPELKRQVQAARDTQSQRLWHGYLTLFEQAIACQNEDLFEYYLPEAFDELEKALKLPLPPQAWVQANPHLTKEGLVAVAAKQCTMVQRVLMVQSLAEAGLPVDLYGFEDWQALASDRVRYRGGVNYGMDCFQVFRQSRINLNITRIYARQALPGRIFDIVGAGGFLLTDYVAEIEPLLVPDEEVVCYNSFPEMVDKARYYLEHEEERRKIARAGYERVWREHTLRQRLDEMIASTLPSRDQRSQESQK